jgi:hypothetical protein
MNFIQTKISFQHKSNHFHANEKLQKLLNIDFESTRRIGELKSCANFRMNLYPSDSVLDRRCASDAAGSALDSALPAGHLLPTSQATVELCPCAAEAHE